MNAPATFDGGWCSDFAAPLRILEALPLILEPYRETPFFTGNADGYEYVLGQAWDGEKLLIKRRSPAGVERLEIVVGYAPYASPWNIIAAIGRELHKRCGSTVHLRNFKAELGLLRETSYLVPNRVGLRPTVTEDQALQLLAERSGLSDLSLMLTHPFQFWSGPLGGPVWSGYTLPQALSALTPTMVVINTPGNCTIQPGEIHQRRLEGPERSFLNLMHTFGGLNEAQRVELEAFADKLRQCSQRVDDSFYELPRLSDPELVKQVGRSLKREAAAKQGKRCIFSKD